MIPCCLAVSTMRACAQGGPRGLAPRAGDLGEPSAPAGQKGFGAARPTKFTAIISFFAFERCVRFSRVRTMCCRKSYPAKSYPSQHFHNTGCESPKNIPENVQQMF